MILSLESTHTHARARSRAHARTHTQAHGPTGNTFVSALLSISLSLHDTEFRTRSVSDRSCKRKRESEKVEDAHNPMLVSTFFFFLKKKRGGCMIHSVV